MGRGYITLGFVEYGGMFLLCSNYCNCFWKLLEIVFWGVVWFIVLGFVEGYVANGLKEDRRGCGELFVSFWFLASV